MWCGHPRHCQIEETAYFLDLAVRASKPVVVTGAMRNASLAGADGPRNLEAALAVAARPGLEGCYVVVGDEVHAAADVTKTHSASPGAFQSPWLGPLGAVEGDTVTMLRRGPARRRYDVARADARVPLLTVAAGVGDALVRSALHSGVDGVVVEGTGVGHVPAPWLVPMREAAGADIPL